MIIFCKEQGMYILNKIRIISAIFDSYHTVKIINPLDEECWYRFLWGLGSYQYK